MKSKTNNKNRFKKKGGEKQNNWSTIFKSWTKILEQNL